VKTFKKKLSPPIVIAISVVVVGLIVGGYFVIGGGAGSGDDGSGAPKPVLTPGDLESGKFRGRRIPPPPRRKSPGVVDEARREGRLVLAQARGTVVKPGRIRLRVSATPKQRVIVDWQLGCFLNRRAKVGRGRYRTRTPNTRRIPVSIRGAETCIATATAGLTKVDGRGRVKVAVIAG
jgi:hypothetical protein